VQSTYQDRLKREGTLTQATVSRTDLGLTEECRQFPDRIALICLAGDAVVILVCLLAAYWLRFRSSLRGFGVEPPSGLMLSDYARYIVFGSASLLAVLAQKQMYEARWLLHRRSRLWDVISTCMLWGAAFLGFSLLFKFQPPLSRVYVAVATSTAMVGLYAWRQLFYCWLRNDAVAEKLRQRILLVGRNPYAQRFKDVIERDPSHPYTVVGWVPTPAGDVNDEPSNESLQTGPYHDIRELVETLAVDIVLLADANVPVKHCDALAALCEKELVQFKVVPSYFSILVSGLHVETISGVPILGVSRLPLDRLFNKLIKRLIDIVGGAVGLLLSAPFIVMFGILIYVESPGPILYRQRRLGRNGRTFQMLKLRSMRLDAEKDGKIGWSTKDDPRRLRIGRFIRKWNIDEVPQFWNVLIGDMSLVGPRPERPELIRDFKHAIPHYNARHTVKPGITGWAQVNGLRGDTNLFDRLSHDLYYVEHWNLLLDLQTMLLTFLKHKNAC